MGQTLVNGNVVNNTIPDFVTPWDSDADSYITNVTAYNLTDTNDGLAGDVIVGFFNPLHESLTNTDHEDDTYFMVMNGLTDPAGTAADCQQTVRVDFDFANSGIKRLQRISRNTGEIEYVNLVSDGNSKYHMNVLLQGGTGDLFKFDNGGWFVSSTPPEVHYTFKEIAPGTWEVLVEVTGDSTAGLSAYEIWVDGVDPATVSFTQNDLATIESYGLVGFSQANLLQGDVGGSFNAGNYQGCGDAAIQGIGMVDIYKEGSIPGVTPLVDLDAQALLGILTTEAGLTDENFRVTIVGLLHALGDDFFDARDIVPTLEVIPFILLPGDANHDGVVSAGDYAAVQANFGNVGEGIIGDANGDGVVSAGDYASVQANFGTVVSGETVPEPATMCILCMGALALMRRCRS